MLKPERMQMNFFPKENAPAKRRERIANTTKSCVDFEYDYFDNSLGEFGYAYGGFYYDKRFLPSVRKLMTYYRIRGKRQRHSVLDYGCAKGFLLAEFKLNGIQHVTGYDVSEYAIENAHELVKEDVSVIKSGEVIDHKENEFSLAICKEVLPYLDEAEIIQLIQNLDKWGGSTYIYTYAVDDEGMVDKLYNAESLLKSIKPSSWWENIFKEAGYSGDYFIESIL